MLRKKAKEAAVRFRDHYDYWYRILDDKNKEKLYRSVLVYDAFRFGTDEKKIKIHIKQLLKLIIQL